MRYSHRAAVKPCANCGRATMLRWIAGKGNTIPVCACTEACAETAAVKRQERRAKEYEK